MIIYFLKSTLCAALLLLLYRLFLEKEKMHRFNRFYLLCSLALSFIVPLLTIEFKQAVQPFPRTIMLLNDNFTTLSQQTTTVVNNSQVLTILPACLYIVIAAAFLYRFIKNCISLFYTIRKNKTVPYHHAQLVLIPNQLVPHSFLNYIFLNKQQFEEGAIEKEILHHELIHVQQRHSLDILFIELLTVVAWFNPLIYFFRKAIQLNHEFLADESVIKTYKNPASYQLLLLDTINRVSGLSFTSRFNYSVTKKRLLMITKKPSLKAALIKQLALLPIVVGILFLFSSKVIAQQPGKPVTLPWPGPAAEAAPPAILEEYNAILKPYNLSTNEGRKEFRTKITKEDRDKLEALFKQMDEKQQRQQMVGFAKHGGPLKRAVPSAETFDGFKDAAKYGVWINEKKVSNEVLNNYQATDFAQYDVSKLYGAAKRNVSYFYQVNMMTKAYYQKYYDTVMANKDKTIMYIMWVPNRFMMIE